MTTQAQSNGTKAAIPLKQSRMNLASVVRGKQSGPLRLGVYGVDGVGKSSFAADAPNPIFLPTEDRIRHIDAAKLPIAQSWQEVLDAVRMLAVEAHDYRTLVLDSLDWTEPLMWAELCRRDGVTSKEEVAGGYGKWVDAGANEIRILLAALERLQTQRGMNVIITGHAIVKNFKNPEGDDYERYVLKVTDKIASTTREWLDAVFFARFEAYADKDKKTKKVKGISTGARVLHTRWSAAYDAKDSYGLPETIPLEWAAFERARAAATPDALRAELEDKAKQLGGEIEAKALELLKGAGTDVAKLISIRDRLDARLAERANQAEPAQAAEQ